MNQLMKRSVAELEDMAKDFWELNYYEEYDLVCDELVRRGEPDMRK